MSNAEASIYNSWAAGRCPCCGMALDEWWWKGEVTQPVAIGEGVIMCGRCIANEHGRESADFIPTLLLCIVARSDAPMEQLLDRIERAAGHR